MCNFGEYTLENNTMIVLFKLHKHAASYSTWSALR